MHCPAFSGSKVDERLFIVASNLGDMGRLLKIEHAGEFLSNQPCCSAALARLQHPQLFRF